MAAATMVRCVLLGLLLSPVASLRAPMLRRAPPAPRTAATTPSMLLLPEVAQTASALLIANESPPAEIGPLLLAQMGVVAGLIGGGFVLDAFFEVEIPKEEGAKEGEIDIFRDSPLRYCGYANECGEAFRPLVPVEVVYFSYVVAIVYILSDTVDKGLKGAKSGGEGATIRGTLGALDTFFWQMLASVLFPSFCINRIVLLLNSLQEAGSMPDLLMASWLPTAAGLITIPLVILPLDELAHFSMNKSFRRVYKFVLGSA